MPLGQPFIAKRLPCQIPEKISLTFPDGSRHEFDTAEEAEEYVKSKYSQTTFFWDNQHFRHTMADIAERETYGWIELDIDGDSTDFLFELERAEFLTVGFHFAQSPSIVHHPLGQAVVERTKEYPHNVASKPVIAWDLPSDSREPENQAASVW